MDRTCVGYASSKNAKRRISLRTAPGSVTGLHLDDEDNFLFTLAGHKMVALVSQDSASEVRVNEKYDSGTICADYDPFSSFARTHPDIDFKHSSFVENFREKATETSTDVYSGRTEVVVVQEREFTITFVLLRPFQPLYIPKNIFHAVVTVGDEPSVSVNAFASSVVERVHPGILRETLEVLHGYGLHRNASCVCHEST